MFQKEELLFALQSQGFYPTEELLKQSICALQLSLPMDLAGLKQLIYHLETTDCKRGLCAVPYAQRGLTLQQLKVISSKVVMDWVKKQCDKFNKANDIAADRTFKMEANLYALDKLLVRATTSFDPGSRANIPAEVLGAVGIPSVPKHDCCFSQVLNPNGLAVDVFVSHFWGHPFERTVYALTNFAATVYKELGKDSPDDVVFWVCLFALNQHQAAEEVGSSPETGPFNIALAKARWGAVMVLDELTQPFWRVWWYPLPHTSHSCFSTVC